MRRFGSGVGWIFIHRADLSVISLEPYLSRIERLFGFFVHIRRDGVGCPKDGPSEFINIEMPVPEYGLDQFVQ
ncbi:hypothetical protein Amal_01935 [Acetobacter malorum]|uniref:Uncharacterized protein n=1 Tax=Acetobacter malorum TaxID=178901 RepID=A0A177GA37_9PROT|nr:hypothetical protein Amal_01935 [Acetobacter malorum]